MGVTEQVGISPQRAWVGTAVAAVVVIAASALALPRLVWDRFLWHYFWGPVFADAHNARCAVMASGGPKLLTDPAACQSAIARGAIVAEPGYTLVSEVGYAITLVFMLVGVLYLVRDLGVGEDRRLFFALVPFMLFGGALRVVEDANDAATAAPGAHPAIAWPYSALIISPLIYVTVFVVVLVALVGTIRLARRGTLSDYPIAMAAVGGLALTVTLVHLLVLAFTTDYLGFYPQFFVATVGAASVIALAVYAGLERWAPHVNAGTGLIGLVVLWGHAIDGVANYLAADWTAALGVPVQYGAKHPVNRILNDLVATVAPAGVQEAIGVAWGFLLVKIVAATAVVWVFDERIFEENPRYALLLLVAIVAVGLGPGTRDMLRATFGI
ncbi:MAG: DUF63 family protein [Haloarculaceae archaeon]